MINALGLSQSLIVDPAAVPIGSENTVYARIGMLLRTPMRKGSRPGIDFITFEARRNYVVLCEPNLTADQAATFRAAAQELPGVQVVSYLDYLLLNSWSGSEVPITIAKDVSREIALKLDASRVLLPGITVDDSAMSRIYPGGPTMSHILGYVGRVDKEEIEDPANRTPGGEALYNADDIIGKGGLELTQEARLRGTKGVQTVEVDTNEVVQRVVATLQEPKPGQNLKLTLDLELQAAMRQAIIDATRFANEDRAAKDRRAGKEPRDYNAGAGAVVMLDARNGEVLAMVSYPDYDNNLFIEGLSERKFQQLNDESAKTPLVNRAMAGHWSPGSTLKLFIATAALREKTIDGGHHLRVQGLHVRALDLERRQGDDYHCWNRNGGHGPVDLQLAMKQSCDIYFYNVGVRTISQKAPRKPCTTTTTPAARWGTSITSTGSGSARSTRT